MMRRPSRRVVISALVTVFLAGAIILLSVRGRGAGDVGEEWSAPGNYIVSYGPVREPRLSVARNTYYLYSPSGEKIARKSGPGSWTPVALPTGGGSYLYFADSLRQVGPNSGEVPIEKRSPVIASGSSPSGTFAVAILTTSQTGGSGPSAMVLKNDGSTVEHELPLMAHSLAVGDENALIVGTPREGEGNVNEDEIFLLGKRGDLTQVEFPERYDAESDFKFP